MSDDRTRVDVTSDGGGNRGVLFALALLIVLLVAAVWFFNQSGASDPGTDITIDLPAGEADPGTGTSISP
jgi:hypothetical protein